MRQSGKWGIPVISILQLRKPRIRGLEPLVQGHPATEHTVMELGLEPKSVRLQGPLHGNGPWGAMNPSGNVLG